VIAAVAAAAAFACHPHAGLGSIALTRGRNVHVIDLATCRERVRRVRPEPTHGSRPLRTRDGRWSAVVRSSGKGRTAKQTIWVVDRRTGRSRPVFAETQWYRTIGPGETPGPIELLAWSGDGRWIFFVIDPGGSGSIQADGLTLRAVSREGGRARRIARMLVYASYLTWCGGELVLSAGFDRVATDHKRLLIAAPPAWRTRPLVARAGRAWGAVVCAPQGRAVVVQSQERSDDANFFAVHWSLWRVGLDGSRRRLTAPPRGYADESPRFSRDGRTLLFVRSRKGVGRLYALRGGRVTGPLLSLGYSLGYYGHQDWWQSMKWSLAATQ
jgi:dipeptidyl aminopeptidase/acylaminoacyl peptidase